MARRLWRGAMAASMLGGLFATGCAASPGQPTDAVAAEGATVALQESVDLACGTLLDRAAGTVGTVMDAGGTTRALDAAYEVADGQLRALAEALDSAGWRLSSDVASVAERIPDKAGRTYPDTLVWLDGALTALEDVGVDCLDHSQAG